MVVNPGVRVEALSQLERSRPFDPFSTRASLERVDGFLDLVAECEEIHDEENDQLRCLGIMLSCVKKIPAHDSYIRFIGKQLKSAKVNPPANKFAWQRFTATVELPSAGYYEVLARATDASGKTQPFAATNWNPQGYGANPVTPVRVLAEA